MADIVNNENCSISTGWVDVHGNYGHWKNENAVTDGKNKDLAKLVSGDYRQVVKCNNDGSRTIYSEPLQKLLLAF